ncbi:MAG: DNA helicase [Anaerolineae bacterium]|jgi:mRNA-degrading endonuclease RelE of RelBE toxin-antitoxin system
MGLIITDRFRKAYRALPPDIQAKTQKALRFLDENPRHPSLQVSKIRGTKDIYEGRVDIKYRFSFHFDRENKVLRNVDNHDDCLKNP